MDPVAAAMLYGQQAAPYKASQEPNLGDQARLNFAPFPFQAKFLRDMPHTSRTFSATFFAAVGVFRRVSAAFRAKAGPAVGAGHAYTSCSASHQTDNSGSDSPLQQYNGTQGAT